MIDCFESLQGLPLVAWKRFEDILSTVGSLAMEGCIFMGELPGLLLETKLGKMVGVLYASLSTSLQSPSLNICLFSCSVLK